MRKIDVFTHIYPKPFYDALIRITGNPRNMTLRAASVPMMTDLNRRFAVMDMFEDYRQILSLASPPLEALGTPDQALELSRIGSDSMAELCDKYPDRFPGFIANPPMNNPDAMVVEAKRAVEDLGARGFQISTNIDGKPLDRPEFAPIFAYAAEADVPVWTHPARTEAFADYESEDRSEYEIWWTFGWPYETSAMMARLVFSKTFDRLPNLKIITHHAGGMVPFFEGRVGAGWDQLGARTSDRNLRPILSELKRPHVDYFKGFYADTATFGSRRAIEHAIEFFGVDHVLFASDAPFDPEGGPMYIRETIKILDALDVSEEDRGKLYHGNAERLLKLPP
ncbi:MAG: amidohydrolase family protein [Bauldia sp.]